MSSAPVIAVDGPSGTGKGTICSFLAAQLGWHLLDSGALYRVVALAAEQAQVAADDETGLTGIAASLKLKFDHTADRQIRVLLDNEDVTSQIRTEECGSAASLVAALPSVRETLLLRQRKFCREPGLIADGRDMGTVVFPDAELKVFVTASPEVRAERRYKQLIGKGISVNLRGLSADIAERDKRDKERIVSPLKPAADAVIIDTSHSSIDDVNEQISSLVRQRFS